MGFGFEDRMAHPSKGWQQISMSSHTIVVTWAYFSPEIGWAYGICVTRPKLSVVHSTRRHHDLQTSAGGVDRYRLE